MAPKKAGTAKAAYDQVLRSEEEASRGSEELTRAEVGEGRSDQEESQRTLLTEPKQSSSPSGLSLDIVQYLRLAKLFWQSEEYGRTAWLLLGLILSLIMLETNLRVRFDKTNSEIVSSLSKANEELFWDNLKAQAVIIICYVPLSTLCHYTIARLGLFWRRSLTQWMTARYLSCQSYYKLHLKREDIDNPDQRIAQDVASYCAISVDLVTAVVSSVASITAFSLVLYEVSPSLFHFLVLYTSVGTFLTIRIFGNILVKLNFNVLKLEADLRYTFVHIRENAEQIAFYGGEGHERKKALKAFGTLYDMVVVLLYWKKLLLSSFTMAYRLLPYVIPAVVIGPAILKKDLEVGKLTLATEAFLRVFSGLNLFVSSFAEFAALSTAVHRIMDLVTTFDEIAEKKDMLPLERESTLTLSPVEGGIKYENSELLGLQDVTIVVPRTDRVLISTLSFALPEGRGLLINGESGCGKSSLLRVIAGLWEEGTGTVLRPTMGDVLFLPQKPYMVLGTLREQLCYPFRAKEVSDEVLLKSLHTVNLSGLLKRYGSDLDVTEDWANVLSSGEQQRLALARICVQKPKFCLMDESTSALDAKNEALFYQTIKSLGITFLSVGHKPGLRDHHDFLLQFLPGGRWEFIDLKGSTVRRKSVSETGGVSSNGLQSIGLRESI